MNKNNPRGFAIIVVLLLIALLAIVAVGYLSVIRYRLKDQQAAAGLGDMQIPLTSVTNDIMGALGTDYPYQNRAIKPEPYDYPWTASALSLMPYTLAQPGTGVTASGFTKGSPNADDAWLASSCLDSTGNWPHVSNLKGAFLDVVDSDLSKVRLNGARQPVPTDTASNNMESNISKDDKRLVDADGDGVPDSLWFYPTQNTVGDRRYVAAVYIEDLSAKINVNTALPLRTGGATGYQAGDLFGLTASDVDLTALAVNNSATGGIQFGQSDTQLANLVAARVAGVDVSGSRTQLVPPMNALSRLRYFAERGVRAQTDGQPLSNEDATNAVGSTGLLLPSATRFGLSDECELRYHGGLNRLIKPVDSPTRIETLLGLRSGADEGDYNDVPGCSGNTDKFFKTNPRRWLTCFSGECLEPKGIDKNTAGSGPNGGNLLPQNRFDCNAAVPESTFASIIEDWNEGVFFTGPNGVAGDGDDYPYPFGFQKLMGIATPSAGGANASCPKAMAQAFCANALGVSQRRIGGSKGNEITVRGKAVAIDSQPVMTEFYAQCPAVYYSAGSGTTQRFAGQGWSQEWGYCIELSNPFATPVKLAGMKWAVEVNNWAKMVTERDLSADADTYPGGWPFKDEDGDNVLLPGHKLLLWRDASAGSATVPAAWTSIIAMVGTKVGNAVTNAPVDPLCGLKNVTAVAIPAAAKISASSTYQLPEMIQCELWGPKRGGGSFEASDYLTFPNLASWGSGSAGTGQGIYDEVPPSGWTVPAVGTVAGVLQCSAKTWGLSAGLDVLQCRPARQYHNGVGATVVINRTTQVNTPTSGTAAVTKAPTGTLADQGDTVLQFRRVLDGFDSTLLDTLGADAKGTAGVPVAFPAAGRASFKNDQIPFSTNDWSWSGGKVRYAHPGRFGSLSDLMQVPMFYADWTIAPNNSKNQSNNRNTDTDFAHRIYSNLHDESSAGYPMWGDVATMQAAGHSALDALRLHPWTDANTFKLWDTATTSSRKATWNWLHELYWSMNHPGMTGGMDWDNLDGDNKTTTGPDWMDGNNDGVGLDTNGNGIKDWTGEVDLKENMAYGRININTMPQWLLEETLPIKDATIRKGVAQVIATARAGAPATGTRDPNARGLAYMAEMLSAIRAAAQANQWDMNGDGTYDAKDLELWSILKAVGPLWQTCGTRSDYFCAHILVQGYNKNDFSKGPVEVARRLVIFRRNSASANAVIVGKFDY